MSLLALDLGGTKLAVALFSSDGEVKTKLTIALNGRTGKLVGEMIRHEILQMLDTAFVQAIGIAVPGIYTATNGTVWAPNIPGWDEYPLLQEIESIAGGVPVVIDSDRACYISGEIWQGNAKGCSDAIFLAVGTGIRGWDSQQQRHYQGSARYCRRCRVDGITSAVQIQI
jgi:glucokinase